MNLSDSDLLRRTDELVAQERKLLIEIFKHLREIDKRRLFSALGFKSLFEYAVEKLKYSEDQTGRRISAMRLLRELPQIEEKIESGALTLSCLGLAQSLFGQEEKRQVVSVGAKLDLLHRLEHKTKHEAEKIVLSQSTDPVSLKPDRVKPVSESKVEIKFVADQSLLQQLEKLKGLLAHSHPDMSTAELVGKACEMAIHQLEPKCKNRKVRHGVTRAARVVVWQKAQGRCQNCGSVHALQIDHEHPRALGGTNDIDNLRLLCRKCNQRAAIEKLGRTKMQHYLEPRPSGPAEEFPRQ